MEVATQRRFEEEKRHIISELTEEKSAHMRTIQTLEEEKKKNEQLLKQLAELVHLRGSFEESQKLMIQSQKKLVDERNKNLAATEKIEHLNSWVEELRSTNDKTQTLFEEALEQLEESRAVVKANPSMFQFSELKQQFTHSQRRVIALEKDYTTLMEKHNTLTENFNSTLAERDQAVAQNSFITSELDALHRSYDSLQKKLDEAHFDLEISHETVSSLQRQLASANLAANTENGDIAAQLEELRSTLMTTETRLARATKQLNAFRLSASEEARRNQESVSSLQNQLRASTHKLQNQSISPEAEDLRTQLLSEQHTNEELQKLLSDLRELNDSLIAKLRDEQDEKLALGQQLEELQAHHNLLVQESEQERRQLEGLKTELQDAQLGMNDLRLFNERLTHELTREKEKSQLGGVQLSLREELDIRVQKLEFELGSARSQIKHLESGREESEKLSQQMERARQQSDERIRTLSEDIHKEIMRRQELQNQCDRLTQELASEQNLYLSLKQESEELHGKVKDLADENQILSRKLEQEEDNHQAERNRLLWELSSLQDTNSSLSAELGAQKQQPKKSAEKDDHGTELTASFQTQLIELSKQIAQERANSSLLRQELEGVTDLKREMSGVKENLEKQKRRVVELQTECDGLVQELKQEREQKEQKEEKVLGHNIELEAEISALQQQLVRVHKENLQTQNELQQRLGVELQKQRDTVGSAELKIQSLSNDLQREVGLREDLQRDAEAKISELTENLQREIGLRIEERDEGELKISSLTQNLQLETSLKEDFQWQVDSLTKELRNEKVVNTEMQKKIEKLIGDLQIEMGRCEDLQAEYDSLVREYKREKEGKVVEKHEEGIAQTQKLLQQIEELQRQYTAVERQLAKEVAEAQDIKKKADMLARDLEQEVALNEQVQRQFDKVVLNLKKEQKAYEDIHDNFVREQEESEHLLNELWQQKELLSRQLQNERSQRELWQAKYEALCTLGRQPESPLAERATDIESKYSNPSQGQNGMQESGKSTDLPEKLAQLEQSDTLDTTDSDEGVVGDTYDKYTRKHSIEIEKLALERNQLLVDVALHKQKCAHLQEQMAKLESERDEHPKPRTKVEVHHSSDDEGKLIEENELLKEQLTALGEVKEWSDRLKEHIDRQREENAGLVATVKRLKEQNNLLIHTSSLRYHPESLAEHQVASSNHLDTEENVTKDDVSSEDSVESAIFEDQQSAHEHSANLLISQIHALLEHLRSLRTKERSSYKGHITRLRHQLTAERDAAELMRKKHEEEQAKIQRDTLEALRTHIAGLKNVYNST